MPTSSVVVYDETFPFRVASEHGSVELRVVFQEPGPAPAELEFWVTVDFITKLSWHFPLSGQTTQTLPLAAGFSLVLDLANWAQTAHQLSFDLVINIKTPIPFVPAIQVYRGGVHIALPASQDVAKLTSGAGPTSIADLLALIATAKPQNGTATLVKSP